MKRMKLLLGLAVFASMILAPGQRLQAQESAETKEKRMQWFDDAKLGIFIHWGIYSVYGIDESWSFHNHYLPYEHYMKQLDGFTAENYDPLEWADLIKRSGARYSVITAKHHDGV